MARPRRLPWLVATALSAGAAVLLTAGCGTGGLAEKGDPANGKQLFIEKCASCHTLADAGAQGTIGPNLDDAFATVREEGFQESSFLQLVAKQIAYPVEQPAGVEQRPLEEGSMPDPECTAGQTPGTQLCRVAGMPADIVTGKDVDDVATYVAMVAGKPALGGSAGGTTTTETQPTETQPTETQPTETQPTTTGAGGDDLAAGKDVFAKAGCAGCHVLKDAGASGAVGPNLDAGMPSRELAIERVTNGQGTMPAFAGQLTPGEIQAVAAYVSTVAGQ